MKPLKNTEKNQLLAYIKWAEDEATYYGDKRRFDARHARIRAFVEALPTVESESARRKARKKAP